MKVLKIMIFLFIGTSLFYSCQKECCDLGEEIEDPNVEPRGTATLGGVVNCINGDPKEGVKVSITSTDGNTWEEITGVDGRFQLNDMPNVEYSFEFSFEDDNATAYTPAEAQNILNEMTDFILGINADFQLIDGLVYDATEDGVLSTLDLVLFEKAYVDFMPSTLFDLWQWKFISVEESTTVTSNSFAYPANLTIEMYDPNSVADLEYIAIRIGDRHGVACDNTPPVVGSPLSGVVNCINGDPKPGVTIDITGSDGSSLQVITDADGKFELNNMTNVRYTFELSYDDVDADAYTVAEAQTIVDEMDDIILGVNQDVHLIDQLIYDVNDNGSITTLDRFLFERRYIDQNVTTPNPMWEWKYVGINGSPVVSSNAISYQAGDPINGYQPATTADLEFVIIRAGDRNGVACDN